MDLAKYLSLLVTSDIRFTRADLLGDSFEGSTTLATKQQMESYFNSILGQLVDPEEQVASIMNQETDVNTFTRTHVYINSWHVNEHESEAMWRIYGKEYGIAIVSSFANIQRSVQSEETILASLVNYIDYNVDKIPPGNYLSPLIHKRKSYEHEQEFRLMLFYKASDLGVHLSVRENYETLSQKMPVGLPIQCQLNELISEVHVSPFAPDWFFQSVSELSQRLNFAFTVRKSSLDPSVDSPIY